MNPSIVLTANDRLGFSVEQRLRAAGAEVKRLAGGGSQQAELCAALEHASVLVLATDDDSGNVDLALAARHLHPDLPLVVRLFDSSLTTYLRETLERVTILSMSAIAAPAFARAALEATERTAHPGGAMAANRPRRKRPHATPDRVLIAALASLVTVVTLATAFFTFSLELAPLDALYFVWTTVFTVGYGDISLRSASVVAKLVGMLLMLAGAGFLAVLFGLFTDWVVSRRLDVMRGRVRVRGRGHLIIAGAGNVGVRVAERAAEKGYRVVVIERDAERKNVGTLRAAGHHVIIADAATEDILDLANADEAGVVLALTSSDAVNLQIALMVRARNSRIPMVVRVVSPELSEHLSAQPNVVAISPVAVAAGEFAAAALAACGPRSAAGANPV